MVPDEVMNKTSLSRIASLDSKEGQASELEESMRPLKNYDTLDFKEMLAACSLDGVELTRIREFPRDTEFDPPD